MKPCGCGGTHLFRACGDGGVLPQGWAGRNQAIVLSAIECPLSTYCGHSPGAARLPYPWNEATWRDPVGGEEDHCEECHHRVTAYSVSSVRHRPFPARRLAEEAAADQERVAGVDQPARAR